MTNPPRLSFDRLDPNLDHRLPVALGPPVLLRPLLLEDENLASPDLAQNLGRDLDALQRVRPRAHPAVSRDEDHARRRERQRLALLQDVAGRPLDADDVSRLD